MKDNENIILPDRIVQKESNNPWVIHMTSNSTCRRINLDEVPFVTRIDGSKGCIWCGEKLKSNHHATRYCSSTELCRMSAYRWANPQCFESMFYLLSLQNFKCMDCYYSYKNFFIEKGLISTHDQINIEKFKKIKKKIPSDRRPEVDHIKAIVNGGLSLGLDNHQILCCLCHKKKTKSDMITRKDFKTN